jgi:pyruvate kinase
MFTRGYIKQRHAHITLEARKGVNVPDCEIDCAALTTKALRVVPYDSPKMVEHGTFC